MLVRTPPESTSYRTVLHGVGSLCGFSHEQLHGDLKDIVDERIGVKPRTVLQDIGMFMRDNYGVDF